MVLFYPAVDPGDATGATATFPVSLPCARARKSEHNMIYYTMILYHNIM